MSGDLTPCWRSLVSPAQPAMQPEQQREGAGNQPEIIEVALDEWVRHQGLQEETVQCIGTAADQEQRVAMETEHPHNSARMKKPEKAASDNLSRRRLMRVSSALICDNVNWVRAVG